MKWRKPILCLTLLAAPFAAAFAVRGRHEASTRADDVAPSNSMLEHRIASIRFKRVDLSVALEKIQAAAGVKIRPQWTSLAAISVEPDNLVSLAMQNVTVSQALDAMLEQLGRFVGYEAVGDGIEIASLFDLPRTLRIYDVSDLVAFDRIRPGEEFETPDLPELLGDFFDPHSWHRTRSRPAPVAATVCANHLMVEQTPHMQRQIACLLQSIRKTTPDGTGPAVSHASGWSQRETVATEIRVYDLRDLVGHLEFTMPAVMRNGKVSRPPRHFAGRDAVSVMIWCNVDSRSWFWACGVIGRSEWLGDRLIAEQTPENHGKIRQVLHDVRSGTAIAGLTRR